MCAGQTASLSWGAVRSTGAAWKCRRESGQPVTQEESIMYVQHMSITAAFQKAAVKSFCPQLIDSIAKFIKALSLTRFKFLDLITA